jgi:hypothetical protein
VKQNIEFFVVGIHCLHQEEGRAGVNRRRARQSRMWASTSDRMIYFYRRIWDNFHAVGLLIEKKKEEPAKNGASRRWTCCFNFLSFLVSPVFNITKDRDLPALKNTQDKSSMCRSRPSWQDDVYVGVTFSFVNKTQ